MTSIVIDHVEPATQPATNEPVAVVKKTKPQVPVQPVLEKLFELYPHLFGAEFKPLKLGIFQDLLAAHPETFEKATLKMALGRHTRSTAYLQCVAAIHQRFDLQGLAVGEVAPEHEFMAMVELFGRRQSRSKVDLRPKLQKQMLAAFQRSGLGRLDYLARVQAPDPEINALLIAALDAADQQTAKKAALVRAYESSGKTVDEFADMYGLDKQGVLAAFKASLGR
jgi:ProP effector